MRFPTLLLLLAGLPLAPAAAQTTLPAPDTTDYARRYAATITPADLERHLRVLASDEYEGRETGEKGQKLAADYLSRQFDAAGAVGPVAANAANPHLQVYNLTKTRWSEAKLKLGDRDQEYLRDFYLLGPTATKRSLKLPVVFAAYGIEQGGASDYAGLDVRGKAVVLLQGEPIDARGISRLTGNSTRSGWTTNPMAKISLAKSKGAAAVVLISTRSQAELTEWLKGRAAHMREGSYSWEADPGEGVPTVVIGPDAGAALLGTTPASLTQYREAAAREGWPLAARDFRTKRKVKLESKLERIPVQAENVLGYLEGTDKKDELVIVSAHYDHLGVRDGKVYNGADDDGSGTVAVIELAEAFGQAKREGHGPRRSILFLSVSGEEKGLLGSEYYSEHPVFDLSKTVADLNIDMVGRRDEAHAADDYVYVIGDDKLASDLRRINEAQNQRYTRLALDYKFNDPNDPNHFYYRSDHYNFARKGVPVAFYFNGVHADYHQETDEVDKILFPALARRARLVFYTAWQLANRDERLKVDSNKP